MSNQSQAVATTANPTADQMEKITTYMPIGYMDEVNLTANIVKKYLCQPTKTGQVCSDRDAIRFVMLCKGLRLNPFAQDAYLVGYDSDKGPQFSLITSHAALLKRAESAKEEYKGMDSGIIYQANRDDKEIKERQGDFSAPGEIVLGGWAKVYREGRREVYRRLSIEAMMPKFPSQFWQGAKINGQIVKCFDEQTEVLTTRGFEKFATAEGQILQVSERGLEPTNAVPFSQPYSGEMIQLENQNLDFMVTPNHDMATLSGRMEAGLMLDMSNRKTRFRIPRTIETDKPDLDIPDAAIQLAAIYLADGTRHAGNKGLFRVSVSKPWKVNLLDGFSRRYRYVRKCAGDEAVTDGGRVITTRADKVEFYFELEDIARLVSLDKNFRAETILNLSKRQARLFANTLTAFDGSTSPSAVRIFYSSRGTVMAAFEIACVAAGYCVSNRKPRQSDIGKENYSITMSSRPTIAASRFAECKNGPVLRRVPNPTNSIWCVKVPSEKIVVRRNGFSFVCHNCAEADALRSAFPALCAGLYIEGEHRAVLDISSEVVNENRKPEATGHTRALNAPAKKKEEPKKAEQPAAPAAPAPEPEQPPTPQPPPEEVPGDAVAALADEEKAAGENVFKPRPSESANLTAVRKLLFEANKPEEEFIKFGLDKKFVKEGQKLADLSEVKLERIASSWKELLKQMG